MDKQAEIQAKRRLELSITLGAAPYQPKTTQPSTLTARERDELKQLRAQRAQSSAPGVFVADPGDKLTGEQLKALESNLANANTQLQANPDSEGWKLIAKESQEKLDQARPPKLKATQLQLSKDLNSKENEVAGLENTIKTKSDQHAALELALHAHCEQLDEKRP